MHGELRVAQEEKSKLAENLQQTNRTVSGLQTRLSTIEATKARNKKIWRIIYGVLFSISGTAVLLWLPAIHNWPWLQSHPHRLDLYFAAIVFVFGLSWGIFAWKGRAWALAFVVLAVIIRIIGILGH